MNERDRLRRQRAEAQSGSTVQRVGRIRREYDPAQEPGYRRRSAFGFIGPLILALAAIGVLGALGFVVFAGDDPSVALVADPSPPGSPTPAPARTPLRGLTGGTASPSPSPTSTPSPSPTTRPTATTAAVDRPPTPPPTPRPTATRPPPPPTFTASVEVCTSVANGTCQGRVTSVGQNDEWVVLLARVDGAQAGDVLGFEIGGTEDFRAGAVTLEGGGSGYAYVELYTRDLDRGNYTVTLTRNGDPVASAVFEKRPGGG